MFLHLRIVLPCCLALAAQPFLCQAGQAASAAGKEDGRAALERDGQRDFDFHTGAWTTHLRRLQNPLSGSTTWVEYEGTTAVREVLGGRANLVELDVEGPAGRIQGVQLRLYDPRSRLWRLNYASLASGVMTEPMTGAFDGGRGEFYGMETIDGRPVLVRFVISGPGPDAWHFEQAFSIDGGRTWEVNWIAVDTRVAPKDGGDE